MKVTSKQYNRLANIVMFAGSVLGFVVAHKYTIVGGCTVILVAGAAGLSAPTIVRRLDTRERFIAEYGSYAGFRARAREAIDYEWLFRNRETRSRRWLIRYVMVQVNLPRRHAEQFVDSLTDDERPATLPPSASSPSPAARRKGDDA